MPLKNVSSSPLTNLTIHQAWPGYFSLSLCADVEVVHEGGHPLVWAATTLYSYTIKIISSIIVVSITIIVSIIIIVSISIIIIQR